VSARILVVDDTPMDRQIVTRALENSGYDVVTAEHGGEALGRLRQPGGSIDVVLLDLMMPVMDGFEFLAELRKDHGWHDIPVIVVTAAELSESDHGRLNGGVERVLQKAALGGDQLLDELRELVTQYVGLEGRR
jgi:adenylate cyclase